MVAFLSAQIKCNRSLPSSVRPAVEQDAEFKRVEDKVMLAAVALWVFLSVSAIALFSFLSVVAWVDCRRREREAYYRSETLRKVSELPGATPESLLEFMHEQQAQVDRRIREGLKLGGLITACVGIGIVIFLQALLGMPISLSGTIPFLVGVALLAYTYVLAPRH
jgi:hypothetical protein